MAINFALHRQHTTQLYILFAGINTLHVDLNMLETTTLLYGALSLLVTAFISVSTLKLLIKGPRGPVMIFQFILVLRAVGCLHGMRRGIDEEFWSRQLSN